MSYRSHANGKHYPITQGHRRFSVASNLETQHRATFTEILSEVHTPLEAETAATAFLNAFSKAETRERKVIIKKSVVSRANRAAANSKNPRLTAENRLREKKVAEKLSQAHKKMIIPARIRTKSGNVSNRWVKENTPIQKQSMGGKCEYPNCTETDLDKLEFVHISETQISRTGGRDRKEKLVDVHKNPQSYRLECAKHHHIDPEAVAHDSKMRELGHR